MCCATNTFVTGIEGLVLWLWGMESWSITSITDKVMVCSWLSTATNSTSRIACMSSVFHNSNPDRKEYSLCFSQSCAKISWHRAPVFRAIVSESKSPWPELIFQTQHIFFFCYFCALCMIDVKHHSSTVCPH